MTDRERFNRQMHYQPVDRCFNMEFGYWEENFDQWPLFVENGITNNSEADVFFNFDRIAGVGGNIWMHPPFERRRRRGNARHADLMNADGLLAEVPKDGHDTIPHFIKSSIVTPDDWKRCKEERFRRDDPARMIDVEAMKARHPRGPRLPAGRRLRVDDRQDPRHADLRGAGLRLLRLPRHGRGHGGNLLPARRGHRWTRSCRTSSSTSPAAGKTSASRTGRIVSLDFFTTWSSRATSASAQSCTPPASTSGTRTVTATSAR